MKAYVMTTGLVFAVLIVAHVWRIIEEGSRLATDPFFVLVTSVAIAFCGWACRLLWLARVRKP